MFCWPSYVPMRFFEAAPGWAQAIETFFMLVLHFLHQNETTAGWQDPKIKFSLKINSPYAHCTVYFLMALIPNAFETFNLIFKNLTVLKDHNMLNHCVMCTVQMSLFIQCTSPILTVRKTMSDAVPNMYVTENSVIYLDSEGRSMWMRDFSRSFWVTFRHMVHVLALRHAWFF
jgi:hypothetical protein